jgi:hypothetical protein
MERKELQIKLAKVEAELWEASTSSYSQSNPSHVLGIRSLKRMRDRLHNRLKKAIDIEQNEITEAQVHE